MFKCKQRRIGDASVDTSVSLDDILSQYNSEDIFYVMQKNDATIDTDIADFIESYFEGGLEAFYQKFKS
jgi:hypothetical protein